MDMQRVLDRAGKERCFPVFVSALLDQKSTKVGQFARLIFDQMVREEYETSLTPGYLEHLLSKSKYNRRDDLPYARILRQTVDSGRRPSPNIATDILEHLFPYTDVMEETEVALKAIIDLQLNSHRQAVDDRQYVIDISTLESVSAAAAATGNQTLNLLVWDAIDTMGYENEPTEAIFENTVMVLFTNPGTYSNAFAVMEEMENRGFRVSRALIRSISYRIR